MAEPQPHARADLYRWWVQLVHAIGVDKYPREFWQREYVLFLRDMTYFNSVSVTLDDVLQIPELKADYLALRNVGRAPTPPPKVKKTPEPPVKKPRVEKPRVEKPPLKKPRIRFQRKIVNLWWATIVWSLGVNAFPQETWEKHYADFVEVLNAEQEPIIVDNVPDLQYYKQEILNGGIAVPAPTNPNAKPKKPAKMPKLPKVPKPPRNASS